MGAHPYYYFVEHQPDVEAALQDLRQREFQAGRYNPVQPFPDFPVCPDSPSPGAKHRSIDEAREDADEDGTRSILDIEAVSDIPGLCVAAPFGKEELERYFGTDHPTKEMVSRRLNFLTTIERGHCIHFTVFEGDQPSELFFAGYSFD